MKKMLAAVLLTALFLGCTACAQSGGRVAEAGRSSLDIYTEFTAGLQSGELQKLHIGMDSWYNAVTTNAQTVRFSTQEDGTRVLLYRSRTPFVFWYYPPFDYYDGTQYYYKYKNDWFIDRTGKYNSVKSQDFLGLQESFLTGNDVFSDAVYQDAAGYTLQTTMQSKDRTRYYELVGKTDLNLQFKKIDVKAYSYNFEKAAYELTDVYYFRYQDINKEISVEAPDDLDPAHVVNPLTAQAQ